MLTLEAAQTLQGVAGTGSVITATLFGDERITAAGTNSFKRLAQIQIPNAAGALATVPPGKEWLVSLIELSNTSGSPVAVTLYVGGTAGANQIKVFTIPANGTAEYSDDGWKISDATGAVVTSVVSTIAVTLTGDVTGTGTGTVPTTVAQIQGRPVSASAPSTGNALVWNGSAWTPTAIVASVTNSDGTIGITGTAAAPIVSRAAITGDVSVPGGSNVSTLATVNSNVGTFGDATHVAQITANAKGLVTAVANVLITAAGIGAVASVAATDASIVVTGTATNPTVATGRLDQIATLHPPTADVNVNSQKIVALAPGTVGTDAINLSQLTGAIEGRKNKDPVLWSTTAAITLSGLGTQAGGEWTGSLTAGDRILVKNQGSSLADGIYLAASGAWTRAVDADLGTEITSASVLVLNGATLVGDTWTQIATVTTIGTDPQTWVQTGEGATLTADGTTLQLVGTTFSIKPGGVGTTQLAAFGPGAIGPIGDASHVAAVTTDATGRVSALSSVLITPAAIGAQATGNYLTALTGDGTATGPGSAAFTLATVNGSPGSFGSASTSLSATVNGKGLITALSSQAIQITESQVTTLTADLAARMFRLAPTAVQMGNYTAAANDYVACDTSGGAFTVTFPTAPADGTLVGIKLVTAGSTLNFALGGSDVFNKTAGSTTGTLAMLNQGVICQYKATGAIWYVLVDDLPLAQLDARYASAGSAITALTGDATATGPGSVAITLATVNSNVGSFGSATQVGTFTVNGKGLITAAGNTAIAIPESAVTNLVSDLALKAPIASPALTGVPTAPTAAQGTSTTQIATTAMVASEVSVLNATISSAIAGLDDLDLCNFATSAALPSCTYANGTAGVGATLTATAPGILLIDTTGVPILGSSILVQNQASSFQNGVYTLTTVGTVLVAFVLTRRSDFDQGAEMSVPKMVPVNAEGLTAGTSNDNKTFLSITSSPFTVGTTGITFTLIGSTYSADNSTLQLSGTTFSEKDGGTTNTKLADMAPATFKMRAAGAGTGPPIDGTATQAKTALAIANTDVSGLGTLSTQNGTFSGTSSGTNTGDQTITLTGDVTGAGVGSFATTLKNTGPGATGPSGSATVVPVITIDAQGRVTALTTSTIAIPESAVTNLTSDLALLAPIASPTFTGLPAGPSYAASGLTGSVAATRWVGGTTTGAPTTGAHLLGDWVVAQDGAVFVCTVAGTPGTWVQSGSTVYAPLASPALTGTPTAPTAAQGTNTTQIATTAMVQSEVTLLAPKASPALTGSPTAPTQSIGDNSTKVATTAYVDRRGGVGTPNTAKQSLTATTRALITGTSIAIPTGSLRGSGSTGSWYRFRIMLDKTAAGTATWTAIVAFGVNNTTADAAIATFTSGTNTAQAVVGVLEIDCMILTTGASATAGCMAIVTQSGGGIATGLGGFMGPPGSTATFDSTVTSPFLHVDITPGASAVMTAFGTVELMR